MRHSWEMSKDWPVEALKAQAVCARTYAVCQTKHRAQGFDICATTHCQVYQGTAASGANSDAAVDQTTGSSSTTAEDSCRRLCIIQATAARARTA